ncbi:U7 snRNA-associated Sm-like protein LSm10 [Eurytemora carolleeae]|uniref:U7 snRNA-associated Sm-like protein LSm10 n=1 Tax=Eurytemora carolleeae TaxID=1294199 RepID=UPI000C764C95|nr:U7 snRNA-associated Sm-like protein LSm10 [Eurytemora carolleeae]|eukprot:XP_023337169.1 U7 snRNA-associated Sm-like protein LSm10 [Eurytemora affinis]
MSMQQERYLKTSGLSCLVSACVGMRTTVELRNEAFVTGKVVQSDGFMNITLEEVEMLDPRGSILKFSSFFIPNRLIRFVQIPESIDMIKALEDQTKQLTGRGRGRGRGHGGDISKQRQKILDKKERRRQEDIRNAMKMRTAGGKMEK